jgi:hypothetical protein
MIGLRIAYGAWLISPISSIVQQDDTNQDSGEGESESEREDNEENTLSSDMEEDYLDHQQQVLLVGQACRGKSSHTTRDPLPQNRSHADTVIALLLLPNPRNPPGSMAPPLLKCQKSALLSKSSESDLAPSTQVLP